MRLIGMMRNVLQAVAAVAALATGQTPSSGPSFEAASVKINNSGDVRVLDASTLEPQATIPVGPRAWWTALTPDGSRLWVTVGRAGEVVAIDTTAGTVAARVRAGTLPWGVAIVDVP